MFVISKKIVIFANDYNDPLKYTAKSLCVFLRTKESCRRLLEKPLVLH